MVADQPFVVSKLTVRVVTVPENVCIAAGGAAVALDVCENVCCNNQEANTFEVTPVGACQFEAVAADLCEPACCITEAGGEVVPAGSCPVPTQPVAACEEVCCVSEGGQPMNQLAGTCTEPAQVVAAERCADQVCCVLPDGLTSRPMETPVWNAVANPPI